MPPFPLQSTGQLGLPGMPARLFACTPSRLATWQSCPRRYRMAYVDRPAPAPGPPWAHQSLGVAVHNALREWWLQPRAARTPVAAAALVARHWLPAGFRDAQQASAWRARAQEMVEGYVASLDAADEPAGVERVVAARTGMLALSGRVDRVDTRDGELVVVDYKTGRSVPGQDDARGSAALALYAVAAERTLRRRCRQVELHHLPSGRVVGWEHTEGSLARQLQRAEAVAGEAAGAEAAARERPGDLDELFPPRPGPRCSWCDVARHCPEGAAAAARRRPWEGLGELQADAREAAKEEEER